MSSERDAVESDPVEAVGSMGTDGCNTVRDT